MAQAILTTKPKTSPPQISQVGTESKAIVQTKDAFLGWGKVPNTRLPNAFGWEKVLSTL